ncbi:MAG: DnaJ domain-containing protein [Spirochaetaceae bacterium]|jgi:tetratricopeptide (TPR) repeat protein|nr:DnaJ domain-containing protein [Spirochaetaceae bacterium]
MEDYYALLGVNGQASLQDIKRAFRSQAKRLHPDLAGTGGAEEMRKLLAAYEVLSDPERRFAYDRVFFKRAGFDYPRFLREQTEDPKSQAKLIFFELLHFAAEEAIAVWRSQGGVHFAMDRYMDREDWMDCAFLLAEALEERRCYYEAFILMVSLVQAERRKPYFKHFFVDLEGSLKELVRLRLKASVDPETYLACMDRLLGLGFPPKDEARWLRAMAETLARLGRIAPAQRVFHEALNRDPRLSNTARLRRKLGV